ncbi:hypothetical protein SAMN06265795_104297 [Noviherbaspirillum humi]|uniref:Uncharacterized protein n=1 Tax=Noviherbaspirillum humi TaxID=1688639 RepID=A0A239G8L7_9BURK|nr:hypothetical protein [Noviherbaspirillum humi]SNS65421.1 hypothetical protein SAMN06265795_104297 [Noviherbaspirillum humi]
MATTLVRVFDLTENAERARNELLAMGIPRDCIDLTATGDEAGPVVGNGYLDDKDTGHGPTGGSLVREILPGGADRTDAYNNSTPIWNGNYIMTVAMDDERQLAAAADIMERCGGLDVEARNRRAHPDAASARRI